MSAPRSQSVSLRGPAGRLQALVERPVVAPVGCAVLCHPHPLHGGTLGNKVVHSLSRVMNELGLVSVRFNFRGVQESEGQFDHGEGEREDVLAVTAWSREHFGDPLWLGGFSFGACMAIRAAGDAGAVRLVLVAPAVERYGVEEHPVGVPAIVVQGMRDEVVDPQATLRWASRQPGPIRVIEFPEAEHFFHGALVQLRRELVAALAATPEEE